MEPNAFITPYPAHVIDDVVSLVKDAEIVGITLMSQFLAVAIDLTRELRKRTKSMVIWGGIHPTVDPVACMKYVDCICVGEGEEALSELAHSMEHDKDYYSTRNFWFKKSDQIIKNPLRPYIQDLDRLPFQDYEFRNHYVLWDNKIGPITKEMIGDKYNTYMTRGCPYSCAFCCNDHINRLYKGQKIIRSRSVDSLINELKVIKNSKDFIGWKRIKLVDDLFPALPLDVLKEFAQRYKNEIGIPLSVCGWTPGVVNEEKVKVLIDAGMDVTRVGIQHGSVKIRKLYARVGTNEKILEAARIFNRYKERLHITYDLITDSPYETQRDIIESLKLFAELQRPYYISIFSLLPFPGTSIYEWAVRDGYFTGDWLTDLKHGKFNGRAISNEYKFTYEGTYYNYMYLIFQAYTLPRFLKRFLINPLFIKWKISYPVYYLLRGGLGVVRYRELSKNSKQFKAFLKRGMDALRKGDFTRIFNSLFRFRRTW